MSEKTTSTKNNTLNSIDKFEDNVLSIDDSPIPDFNSLEHLDTHYKSKKHDDNSTIASEIKPFDHIPESTNQTTNNNGNSNAVNIDDISDLKSIDEDIDWFKTREYQIFKNQLTSLRKNNIFILKECKECKRLLDLKFNDLNSMVNNIQTSVIFISTLSGFLQATKTQFQIDLDIISVCSITISTYISLILSISKYYKFDELKDTIQTLREKYSLLHNRIEYRMDVLGPWNNKHLWEYQDSKMKFREWTTIVMTMQTDYNELIRTKQDLTTEFEIIMDTISRNKYNNLNNNLNYVDREMLFQVQQKENYLEQKIIKARSNTIMNKRPSIRLQHEELDNWDEESSVV